MSKNVGQLYCGQHNHAEKRDKRRNRRGTNKEANSFAPPFLFRLFLVHANLFGEHFAELRDATDDDDDDDTPLFCLSGGVGADGFMAAR